MECRFLFQINDLERHLEACQEKTQYEMFQTDRPPTETSLIDEIDAVMTTDDLYRRLAELKLELAGTERDLAAFHYKTLRNGESMFLSHGNLHNNGASKTFGCRCISGKCGAKPEVRCSQGRVCAASCTNLATANEHLSTTDANCPRENRAQLTARPRSPTRTRPTSARVPPRRACSLRDTYVPKPTPCIAGPTGSSGINRRPSFQLAKAPVRRYDSDSAYILTKNNRCPTFCSGPNGEAQRCPSPLEQHPVTSSPVTRTGLRPRIHAPLRRLADRVGPPSLDHDSVISSGTNQTTTNNQQIQPPEYCSKNKATHRKESQDSDTRNDTITTYDSGVGTLSDCQEHRLDGQGRRRRVTPDAPQTSWLRRRSASITGHLGVLPSKLKAFMPGRTQANDRRQWTSCDSPLFANPLATRVGDVDIEALSSKYRLGGAVGEKHDREALRRQNAVDETRSKRDYVDAAILRGDVTKQHLAVPPGEHDMRRCYVGYKAGGRVQRSASGCEATRKTAPETRSIRRYTTVNSADFASAGGGHDTAHRRVTRSGVTPWRTAVDTKSRASVCHHCGTLVSSDEEREPRPRCCTDAKDVTTPEISAEALAHIAVSSALVVLGTPSVWGSHVQGAPTFFGSTSNPHHITSHKSLPSF